jgi:YceI-like protein
MITNRLPALVLAPVFAALLAPLALSAQPDAQWVGGQSTLSYHMSHPMHEVDGTSHEARGKGVCHAGACDFLIAVPVKSFDSGDTNRDLHMIEATRGAQNPMIVVRAHFAQAETVQPWIHADLEVQFAGQTAHYAQVAFARSGQGNEVRITGTIPLTCSEFKIERPSFLTVPIKNEIPVHVDMTWHSQ